MSMRMVIGLIDAGHIQSLDFIAMFCKDLFAHQLLKLELLVDQPRVIGQVEEVHYHNGQARPSQISSRFLKLLSH